MAKPAEKINYESFRDAVLEEYKKGNVVYMSCEGPMSCKLSDILNQPADGLLYDLNRDESVVLTFIEDPKWVNDYAVATVIRELMSRSSQYKSLAESQIAEKGEVSLKG
jgi:hypothetical protein